GLDPGRPELGADALVSEAAIDDRLRLLVDREVVRRDAAADDDVAETEARVDDHAIVFAAHRVDGERDARGLRLDESLDEHRRSKLANAVPLPVDERRNA